MQPGMANCLPGSRFYLLGTANGQPGTRYCQPGATTIPICSTINRQFRLQAKRLYAFRRFDTLTL
ncbi:hypothetical protein [Paenisporosarcina sp. HGH0030]|uniref:hypothetical protein n=1 Tax=Paenisporosarcina sp. HGH0030 TaxID=1078085 RepID=UPI00039B7D8E|nr:hypothetical protein [Paenisporosarcina sp. HGH0030]